MSDPFVLLAFAVCLVFIAAAVFRRIDWFVAAIGVLLTLVALALFGHWPAR